MTQTQIDALIELMGGRMKEPMRRAMGLCFIEGYSLKSAARACDVHHGSLSHVLRNARKKMRLACTLVTGEAPAGSIN